MSDKLKVVNFHRSNGDRSSDLSVFDDGMTRQEFADECDINVIMAQYEKTGVLSHVQGSEPMYYDFTGIPDLMGAMEVLHKADEAFMRLPAKVRREFDNDPVMFVEFASDAANLDRMRELGLAAPAPAEEPEAPPAVPGPTGPQDLPKPPSEAPKAV